MTINAGAFYDKTPGLAHFCEHMLFLGNAKYPDPEIFSDTWLKHSGNYNAFTSQDKTTYFFEVDNPGFQLTLDIFSGMFDQPLFNSSYIDKEINAVNSEHNKNINNDLWWVDQLVKRQGNQNHPFSFFSTGTKETLGQDINRDELRDQWQTFYYTFYIPENMKLAVYSNYTIDELEDIVCHVFNFTFENRKNTTLHEEIFDSNLIMLNEDSPFHKEDFTSITWYKSASGKNVIDIYFIIDEVITKYKVKPIWYWNYILDYKGEGSLVRLLKDNNLIVDISFGIEDSYAYFATYKIKITLTELGILNYPEVIKLVFSYINFLRTRELNIKTYVEWKRILDTEFNFRQKKKPSTSTIEISEAMFKYDYRDIIYAPYMLSEFNKDTFEKTWNQICVDNAVIIIGGERELSADRMFIGAQEKVWKYYDKEYYTSWWSEEYIRELKEYPINVRIQTRNDLNEQKEVLIHGMKDFRFRPENIYVTNKTKLISPCYLGESDRKKSESDNPNRNSLNTMEDACKGEYNINIKNYKPLEIADINATVNPRIRVLYKIDKTFLTPITIIKLKLENNLFISDRNNHLNLNLLANYYEHQTSTLLSDALEINNNVKVNIENDNITLTITCYSDWSLRIFEKWIDGVIMNESAVELKVLSQLKSRFISAMKTKNAQMPAMKNSEYLHKWLGNSYYSYIEITEQEIQDISWETFNKFNAQVRVSSSFTMLVHGDTNETEVKELSIILNKRVTSTEKQTSRKFNHFIITKPSVVNYYTRNTFINEKNHATTLYFQLGERSVDKLLYLQWYEKCIGNWFFNELRTIKQLGYVVKSFHKVISNILYYIILVQGTVKYPEEVENDINEAIEHSLSVNCQSNFNEIKNALRTQISRNENNWNERNLYLWDLIWFSRDFEENKVWLQRWDTITSYEDVSRMMKKIFKEEVKRISVMNYANEMKEEEIEKRIKEVNGRKYALNERFEVVYSGELGYFK